MKVKRWIIALSLLPFPAPAQETPLTLPQALERAQDVAPKLRQLEALRSAAASSRRGATGNLWPSVNAEASYTRLSDVPELIGSSESGPVVIFPNIPNNYRTRVEASLPLFTGGRNFALIDAAKSRERGAGSDLAAGTADLTLETTVAYWNLVTTAEAETVLKAALASYEAHLKDTENRQKSGLAARNEVLAVAVERDQSALTLIRTKNVTGIAHANLLRLLDYPAETLLRPTDPLDVTPPTIAPLEELVGKALAGRPERASLQAKLETARKMIRAARADFFPQLAASGGYDYTRPNKRIVPWTDQFDDTWDVGVGLRLNLFEGGKTAAAVDQAKAQAEGVRQQLADLDQRIRLEVTSRLLDFTSAQAAVPVAVRGVTSATENLKVSQNRYRAGVIPSSELLDAETALLHSGLRKVDVLARLQIARAELARAVGE